MGVKDTIKRGTKLATAAARWTAAGCPVRSDEEIRRCFAICLECDKFVQWPKRPGFGSCGLCTCRLNITGKLNKIKMATESCPHDPPKWVSTVKAPEVPQEEVVPVPASIPAAPKPEAEQPIQDAATRRQQRRQRIEARGKRIAERAAREAEKPPLLELPGNDDPLEITDRNGTVIGPCLRNLWSPSAGFLLGGGPSLKLLDLSPLKERGIVSLGINNVAGYAPCKGFICGDPPEKFHHGIWFSDMWKFVPTRRLGSRVRAKMPDGSFAFTSLRVKDCPNVWGYKRDSVWEPKNFLRRDAATWGRGDKQAKAEDKPHILFSFFVGLRIMHYLGCRRVYLLGVDFAMDQDHGYAFDQARTDAAIRGNNNSYRLAIEMCQELKPYFDAAGYEIFNCNRRSRLTAWPYVPFEEAVEDCRGLVPKEPWDTQGWYEKPGEKDEDNRTETIEHNG